MEWAHETISMHYRFERERERRVKKFINDTLLDIYKLIILNKNSFYKRPNLILLEIF